MIDERSHMSQIHNPFFNRHRITDPAYFFGREREVERLYSAIATHQCVSVVGERKLGKSSLLTHISQPATLTQFGFDPALYVFVYLDLEGLASARRDDFWPELLDSIASQLPAGDLAQTLRRQIDSGEVRFLTARRALRRIRDTGLEIVLACDEFESLARNASFEPDFYGELRSLAGELGLVMFTASKRSLYDLTYEHSGTLSSPFFNIFSEMSLRLMSEEDARQILVKLSEQAGQPFCDDEVKFGIDLAGPHPFFVQIAGKHLFEAPGRGRPRLPEIYDLVRKRFTAEAEDHYRYIWSSLDQTEQAGLLKLPRITEVPLKSLRAKSLVREVADRPVPFGGAFAAFIDREKQKQQIAGSTDDPASASTGDLTGRTLGAYRVLEPLGRGGMAEVYKGYHPLLDRYVAIKVLHSHFSADAQFAERFQREAATVAKLRHPNIVQVYDFGLHEGVSYMAMEFVAGVTLKERLSALRASSQPMTIVEAVGITREVASALDHAHAHGLVHRDVKPANILLREITLDGETLPDHDEAILTDFGIAKILEGVQFTATGMSMGTPAYMSPEQARGDEVSTRADVYALGVVFFEMLTGELPFNADTPMAVLLKHISDAPPSPRLIAPHLPDLIDAVFDRALAKNPNDRFASAGEFANAIAVALGT
jgi:tRNA A-37 threonylcarbamoyl transferase component Bud32